MLRPDGSVFAPGALVTKPVRAVAGHTAIYHPATTKAGAGVWTSGPDFQPGDDAGDEYSALLPNGNVLVEANTNGVDAQDDLFHLHARRVEQFLSRGLPAQPRVHPHGSPLALAEASRNPCAPFPQQTYHLYEFDGTNFPITADVLTCGNSLSLLPLPSGQIMVGGVALYDSISGNPAPSWAPTITNAPSKLRASGVYTLKGTQLTGLSKAAEFGDEFATPTNYPLVRITNGSTGHVVYARTHDWSTSAIATGNRIVSTLFDVPAAIEPGVSALEVVANGIPSRAVTVTVE